MALATAHVEILADTSRFERDLQSKLRASGASAGKAFRGAFQKATSKMKANPKIGRGYATAGTTAGRQFSRAFARAAGSKIKISKKIGGGLTKSLDKEGSSAGKKFGAALLKGLVAPLAGIGKTVSAALSSITDIGGGGGKMFGPMAIAAGAAAAAVAPLVGVLAALPAAVSGAAAVLGTLVVAFQGMGDAISAGWTGDVEEFSKALQRLAPSAQSVTKEIVGLKPALSGLKSSVQGAFFEPLVGQISELSTLITGPLSSGMTALSGALGSAASAMVQFFAAPATGALLETLFQSLAESVREIIPGLILLTKGFLDMSAAGAASLGGIGPMLERIGTAMSSFANGGGMVTALAGAANAASQLGAAFAAIGPGLSAMMGPIGVIGESVRSVLEPAFAAIGATLTTLAPVFSQVFGILGGVLQAVIPPAAAALQGIAQVVAAILTPALDALGPIITMITNALGPALTDGINQVIPLIVRLATQIGGVLAGAFRLLAPVIEFLLPLIIDTFNSIVMIITNAVNIISGVINLFTNIFSGNWAAAWQNVKDIFWNVISLVVELFKVWILGKVLKLLGVFGNLLSKLWTKIWNGVSNIVKGGVNKVLGFVGGLKDRVVGFFSSAGQWLLNAGKAILRGLLNGLKSGWNAVTGFVGGIGSWIKDHKGPISYDRRLLIPAGRAIMSGFNKGLQTGWGGVQKTITGLTHDIPKIAMPISQNSLQNRRHPHGGLMAQHDRAQRATHIANNRTTTVSAPITVHAASADPSRVARRAADRIARLATA